jgi:phage repressor protein C with HTH and peptisase S24 domain
MALITLEYADVLEGQNEKKVLTFSKSLLNAPVNEKSLFVVRVDGESMQPAIQDRALVVADLSQKSVEARGIYLVQYENRMWIKQAKNEAGKMTFVSINPSFSHLVYDAAAVRVVAKVVLAFSRF